MARMFGGRLPLKNSGTSYAAVGLFLQAVPARKVNGTSAI